MYRQNRVKKSLRFSFLEGVFSSGMVGFTSDYITPYALALKATPPQIGFLTAIPFLASSLGQLKSADITERLRSRKKVINIFIFLHTLMLLPIMFIPYWFKAHPVTCLIIFMTLFTGFNTLTGPVYAALLSEYVPFKMRGRYFGWRGRMMSLITICCSLVAGFILQHFKGNVLKGFFILFSIAFILRLVSWYFLTLIYEPHYIIKKESVFSFLDFIKNIRRSNFVKFVLFVSGMQFCVNVASPFFSVFMIRDLKFNYVTYTILVTAVTAVQILTIKRWGLWGDRAGNVKILRFTSLVIASLPLWWLISQNPVYLFFTQLLSGFAWAGFNLAAGNFIYDAVTPSKRIRCIGYFNVFVGLAVFLGGIIGGYLAQVLPKIFGYQILTLFLISSILRFIMATLLSRRIKEVRSTEKIKTKDLVCGVLGIKPITYSIR